MIFGVSLEGLVAARRVELKRARGKQKTDIYRLTFIESLHYVA